MAAYFVVPRHRPPHWSLQIVLGTLAFVMSICWLNLEANECIAILEAFGLIFDIDTGESFENLCTIKYQFIVSLLM